MDYLVNLSLLSPDPQLDARVKSAGVTIRRALAPELELATNWIREKFSAGWSSETAIAFSRQPPSCFLATKDERLVGFACYNSIARGFFGPTGVDEAARGAGIGHALLLGDAARHAHARLWLRHHRRCRAVGILRAHGRRHADPRFRARRLCRPPEARLIIFYPQGLT